MKLIKFLPVGLTIVALTACSNSAPPATSNSPTSQPTISQEAKSPEHPKTSKGGQVIETGEYHLEFVPEKEDSGIHLDFYLQKGDRHEPVPNAKVTAQIQLPDGSQKTLPLTYDTAGKHYAALLSVKTPGEYKVAVLSEIEGKKVNGRFSFKQ